MEFKSTGDAETDEVLRQMAEEGSPMPEFAQAVEEPVETEVEEVEETEDEAEEVDTEEEEDEEEEPVRQRSVPRQKYDYLKEKLGKLEGELAEFKKNPQKNDVDDEIKRFAEEQNLDIDAAYKLADLVSKKAIPDDLRETLESLKAERQDKEMWDSQHQKYEDEFTRSLAPIIKRDNPKITDKELRTISKEMREEAFEGDNADKSLVQLYLSQPKKRFSGEPTSVRSIPKTVNMEDMTAEDISDMSDADFEEFSNNLGKKSPKLTR